MRRKGIFSLSGRWQRRLQSFWMLKEERLRAKLREQRTARSLITELEISFRFCAWQ